jgi:hypothetical protein
MFKRHLPVLLTAFMATGVCAQSTGAAPWTLVPAEGEGERGAMADPGTRPLAIGLADRDALGLPGQRPRLTMSLPLDGRPGGADDERKSAFSWSLKTWQLNTASLAHIQCSQGMWTINSYLAQDCRFVEQPLPSDSVNLLQVSGDWTAAPGLQVGVSAFRSDEFTVGGGLATPAFDTALSPMPLAATPDQALPAANSSLEGLDVNVSFGIQTERVGDFLLGLQVARYRQRMSLSDLAIPSLDTSSLRRYDDQYGNSASLVLGWRGGSFGAEMLGRHREVPLWLGGNEPTPSTFNSFDLEFSWHPSRSGSLSIGVSNIMDAAPRAEDARPDAGLEDPVESVYGRIPYVRYKQDL